MVWYSHLFQNFPQFLVTHTVEGFGIVNKAEIDVFLELSCFFHDPADVGNLISGSSAFCKSSLNIWKFTVHVLLKPGLEAVAATAQELQMSYPTSKVRGGRGEELPHVQGQGWWPRGPTHVQGKEQRLHFAGAVIKRYPTSKVRETQIRW